MKTPIVVAALTLFLATAVTPLHADVAAKEPAVKKATKTAEAKPAKKKRKGLFEGELNKDRSLSGEKVPMTDDKPREKPYKSLGSELRKDRSK